MIHKGNKDKCSFLLLLREELTNLISYFGTD